MTACNRRYIFLIGLFIVGWASRLVAESAATDPGAPTTTTSETSAASGDKTVAHKSSHKKKKKSVAEDTTGAATGSGSATHKTAAHAKAKTASVTTHAKPNAGDAASAPLNAFSPDAGTGVGAVSGPITGTKPPVAPVTPIIISSSPGGDRPSTGPEVETGLPVARHSGHDSATGIDASPRTSTYQMASIFPGPAGAGTIGSYSPARSHTKGPDDNFTFTNFSRRAHNTYPWKLDIITTVFYIGEVTPNSISTTKNVDSAWQEDWRSSNGGTDTPDDRRGYMPAHHAARENPFYVALPFNDLACPEKARRWLPANWSRPPRDGKQVSACKDRWIEIKNAQGETCYAQWEDVGPLRYDHAEYVFGDERPNTYTRAGLDVSPAVADYLNLTGKNRLTRWRFVDDADVQPGMWLKYDEEALIYKAMHSIKEDRSHILPIQQATAPINDDDDVNSTRRKIGAAKG